MTAPGEESTERSRTLEANSRELDSARVVALSDGVFAIVITLLVLEIHVPELGQGDSLEDALRDVRPSFVAFLISFVVVGIAWADHRNIFAFVVRTDWALVWLNLLPVSIVPFGASLLARYDRDPVALEMYGILLVAASAVRLIMWLYVTGQPHLLLAPVDGHSRWRGVSVAAVSAVAYGIAVWCADAAPTAALLIFALVPGAYFAAIGLSRAAEARESGRHS